MTTYVLVAGAGLGGWTWQEVTRLLEANGHAVYAPSLTGAGDRAHLLGPDVDLETHVLDVANVLHYEDLHEVVLVGHSYGGVVVTGAADRHPDRVQKLVYVDAPMGLSHAEIFPAAGDPAQFPRETLDGIEVLVMPSQGLVAFYGITDRDEVAWTLERMTPHPAKASEQRLVLQNAAALEAIPRYHIVASRTVELGAHEALPASERAEGRYFQVEGPHALMVIAPHEVADLLMRIVAAHPAPRPS
jgi:pimeloyl-ACP methyl ester carboxylesterase